MNKYKTPFKFYKPTQFPMRGDRKVGEKKTRWSQTVAPSLTRIAPLRRAWQEASNVVMEAII